MFGRRSKQTGRKVRAGSSAPRYQTAPSQSSSTPFKKPSKVKQRSSGGSKLKTVLLICLFLAIFVYLQLLTPKATVSLNDKSYHSTADYSKTIDQHLSSLTNRLKLTFNRAKFERQLKTQYPEIDKVVVQLPFFGRNPKVKLVVAPPSFNLSSGGQVYIVSANGFVATNSSQFTNASKLPSVVDQSGFVAAPGKQVLSRQSINFINTVLAQAKRGGVSVQSMTLPTNPAEVDLRAADRAYYVKFNITGDATLQAGQYLAARHKFDAENTQPSEYLDVRVSGKIYYK